MAYLSFFGHLQVVDCYLFEIRYFPNGWKTITIKIRWIKVDRQTANKRPTGFGPSVDRQTADCQWHVGNGQTTGETKCTVLQRLRDIWSLKILHGNIKLSGHGKTVEILKTLSTLTQEPTRTRSKACGVGWGKLLFTNTEPFEIYNLLWPTISTFYWGMDRYFIKNNYQSHS